MSFRRSALIALCGALVISAGCKSAPSAKSDKPAEYVEIPNPMMTQGKDAPATIWVPVSAEAGIPRGSELVKDGVQMAKEGMSSSPPKQAAPSQNTVAPVASGAASAVVTTSTVAVPPPVQSYQPAAPVLSPVAVKKRIALVEVGQNGLILPFSQQVKSLGFGVPVDLAPTKTAALEIDQSSYAGDLWKDNTASVLVLLAAPDGVGGGQTLVADIYDGLEKTRLRRVSTVIPAYAASDRSALASTLNTALADLALRVGDIVNLTPWYGKVFAVDGERIYVNAGRESGLRIGQKLNVYRDGKTIAGIGFDPGATVATLDISGFIGTNGSYGVVKGGQSIRPGDLIAAE